MKHLLLCLALATNTLFATPTRLDIPEEFRWNLDAMYPTHDHWHQEFNSLQASATPYIYKGALASSAEAVQQTLTTYFSTARKYDILLAYAHLSHYQDMADPQTKALCGKIDQAVSEFAQKSSWIQPELFSLPDSTLQEYIKHPQLIEYSLFLERLARQKPHVRTSSEEELLAQITSALDATSKAYSALTNVDLKFGQIQDSNGNWHELTLGTAPVYSQSTDRMLRKNAAFQLASKYIEHENTITELFAGVVKNHHFIANARHYNSCLEAALSPNNIDVAVYHNLIKAVRSRLDLLHRYNKLKKELLGLDELHSYDLGAPLVTAATKDYSYAKARELVLEAVSPLGSEYQNILRNGLTKDRWADVYETTNKRSGAYSSGCYDCMPYMSLNFKGDLNDVFTLIHESGHSMHTYYSKTHQPFHTGDYSIFVAEVASLFNESLLRHMLLSRCQNKNERLEILNRALEDMSRTLFRQTQFAEFELFAHTSVEQNTTLTPKLLKDTFLELSKAYSGPAVTADPEFGIVWAVIPHFYNNFYVYQYATGISAALALSDQVLKGNELAKERYLDFLKAGSSSYPLDVLAKAGCDMRSPEPIHKALDVFEAYLNEFEQLLKQ